MREIKFRAWDIIKKHWVYKEGYTLNEIAANGYQLKLNELEWVQYTGLKDKNGKEIYEGDIVKWNGSYDFMEAEWNTGIVKVGQINLTVNGEYFNYLIEMPHFEPISKNGGDFQASDIETYQVDEFANKQLEVIGNIYENPELLEAK